MIVSSYRHYQRAGQPYAPLDQVPMAVRDRIERSWINCNKTAGLRGRRVCHLLKERNALL
jgi:hypothetical protein